MVATGDLVRGETVLITKADRHVYYTTEQRERRCRNCDLKEVRPFPVAAENEQPCPKTGGK